MSSGDREIKIEFTLTEDELKTLRPFSRLLYAILKFDETKQKTSASPALKRAMAKWRAKKRLEKKDAKHQDDRAQLPGEKEKK